MRFVVFGAGGIGGVVGARLAQHGGEVALVARGEHAAAIAARGLRVQSAAGTETVDLPITTDLRELHLTDDDVVLLAVKSHHTAAALDALAAASRTSLPVVCLQNGVDNERMALRRFANVYGAAVMCPTGHLEPGVVQAFSSPVTGLIDIGRFPAGVDATSRGVVDALSSSSFDSFERDDIMRWKYAKLLLNLGNAIEAVCGPAARRGPLAAMVRDEGIAVLRAAGVDFAGDDEELARRGELLTIHPVQGQRRGGSSTWQSLARATGTVESDYLNGEIVLMGRLHGISTPANALLQTLANQLAAARSRPGSIPAEVVIARLGEPT